MNLLACIFVILGGALGIAILVQTGIKSLVGWALVALSVGILIQEVLTKWSHSVHA